MVMVMWPMDFLKQCISNMQFANVQGKKNPGTDRHSVIQFLQQVMQAKEMKIDK